MASAPRRQCKTPPDKFCYICGRYLLTSQCRTISVEVKKAYFLYFGCKLGDQEKTWAPHVCCVSCHVSLIQWLKGNRSSMPFAVPMIWREPTNHSTDCYFCLTKTKGYSKKKKQNIEYPTVPSAILPVPHGEGLPIPTPPLNWDDVVIPEEEDDECFHSRTEDLFESSTDPSYVPPSSEPQLVTQNKLNDLVRDLGLSKQQAELLGSRLQEWNLLAKGTTITSFRKRNSKFSTFYRLEGPMCVCFDVVGLMSELEITHIRSEWRLFIDSSKSSLKAVLLHNGNEKPSIPVAYSVSMKENYDNLAAILKAIKYQDFEWKICGDLKVIAILMGLQGGYTKYCCFLCLWDSRDRRNHYVKTIWPSRKSYTPGEKNVLHEPLVDPNNVLLPPLHIKLGLMKNFVKGMDREGPGFKYLSESFPRLSEAKIKEGVFTGPDIRKVIRDPEFEKKLNQKELAAWKAFVKVVNGFLGNRKEENYKTLVVDLLETYNAMGCRMSLKIHFLHSHMDFFPENLGAVSDEQGERFHQDIRTIETRYQGRWDPAMLGDYCWFLKRDDETSHKRRK